MNGDAALVNRLYTDIEWALAQGLPLSNLLPMLERLAREAEPDSAYAVYAKRQLAELLVQDRPFQAARLAREVLEWQADDRCYSVLGMALMSMGHYGSAARAFQHALAMAPQCPWYSHNLGHILDVGLDRPKDALAHLEAAHRGLPHEREITSSLAHALYRAGQIRRAHDTLVDAVGGDKERAAAIAVRWGWATPCPYPSDAP